MARRNAVSTSDASAFGARVAARAGSHRNAARTTAGQRHGRSGSSGGTISPSRIWSRPASSRIRPESPPASAGPSLASGGADGGSIFPPSSSSTGVSPVSQAVKRRGLTRLIRETADGSIWVTPRTSPSAASRREAPQDGQVAASTGTVAEHHGQVSVLPLGLLRAGLTGRLLPLDGGRGLRGDVIHHSIHARHLVHD